MNISQQMLPDNALRIRRLVVFDEADWDMLGEVFDEHQFRALFVAVLTKGYCDWLRSKGIVDKESREASGLTINDFIKHAALVAKDFPVPLEQEVQS